MSRECYLWIVGLVIVAGAATFAQVYEFTVVASLFALIITIDNARARIVAALSTLPPAKGEKE